MPAPTDPEERDALRRELVDAETERVLARRGRTLIVANKLGIVQAAAGVDGSNVRRDELALLPADPDASAARLRAGAARPARRGRRRGRHRHDGPLLAGRADRRRDRRGGPRRCCTATAARVDVAGQRAARHRGGAGRRARRAPPTWSRASSAACRSPWCAGCAPLDDGSTARDLVRPARRRPVLASAPRRRSPRAAGRPCCCGAACATFADAPVDPAALRRAVGVALTAPAPHHSTPFRFAVGARAAARALLDAMADRWRADLEADGAPGGRGRAPDAPRRPAAPRPRAGAAVPHRRRHARLPGRRPARARAHDVHRRRRRGGAVAAGGAGRRGARLVLGRFHDLRRRTSCARCWTCPPTGSRSARSRSACPREPLSPRRRATRRRGCSSGDPARRRACEPGTPRPLVAPAVAAAELAAWEPRRRGAAGAQVRAARLPRRPPRRRLRPLLRARPPDGLRARARRRRASTCC